MSKPTALMFALVSVPLNTPSLLNVNPSVKPPPPVLGDTTGLQVYGGVPPDAASVTEYGTFSIAAGSVSVVVIIKGSALIVSAKLFVADMPALSTTRTLKLNVPSIVGVPFKTPPLLRFNPLGSVPATSAQVYGAVVPEAAKVCA